MYSSSSNGGGGWGQREPPPHLQQGGRGGYPPAQQSYQGGGDRGWGGGGGGGRKRGREDEQFTPRPSRGRSSYGGAQSSPQQSLASSIHRYKQDLYLFPAQPTHDELDALVRATVGMWRRDPEAVREAFRVLIAELPYKLPYSIVLLSLLSSSSGVVRKPATFVRSSDRLGGDDAAMDDAEAPAEPDEENVGLSIVRDLVGGFQGALDQGRWRSARAYVVAFTELALLPQGLVSVDSLVRTWEALIAPLADAKPDEQGGVGRMDELARAVAESLLRAGTRLPGPITEPVRDALVAYAALRRELLAPAKAALAGEATEGQWVDLIERLLDLPESAMDGQTVWPSAASLLSSSELEGAAAPKAIELPVLVLPPAQTKAQKKEEQAQRRAGSDGLKGDEGVGIEGVRAYVGLFREEEGVPSSRTLEGLQLRLLIHDMIDLFEPNRRECSHVLLGLPLWVNYGVLRDKKAAGAAELEGTKNAPQWDAEALLVEAVVGKFLALPKPRFTESYYYFLMTELCVGSPSTIAPALGKSIRRLYAGLGEREWKVGDDPSLEAEGVRRFAEWFGVHLSNFGFTWKWDDWAADMELSPSHPKVVFVRRVIENEVRLSYFDRVRGTIGPNMLATGRVIGEEAPTYDYTYEAEGHALYAQANELLAKIRAKVPMDEVKEFLDGLVKSLQVEGGMSEDVAVQTVRDLAFQTLLFVGSRSFSHFLNAVERYSAFFSSLLPTPEAKQELLSTISRFWTKNAQFHLIVIDKLLQYRFLSALDVAAWIFSYQPDANNNDAEEGWAGFLKWDGLQTALKATDMKVKGSKGYLKRLEDNHLANVVPGGQEDIIATSTERIEKTKSDIVNNENEFGTLLLECVKQFSAVAAASPVEEGAWEGWWIEGWFREFGRSYGHLLAEPNMVEAIRQLGLDEQAPTSKALAAAIAWAKAA